MKATLFGALVLGALGVTTLCVTRLHLTKSSPNGNESEKPSLHMPVARRPAAGPQPDKSPGRKDYIREVDGIVPPNPSPSIVDGKVDSRPSSTVDTSERIQEPVAITEASIGPFRVSDSVVRNCLKGSSGSCEDQMIDLVNLMLNEPRDEAWASECERRLRSLVEMQSPSFLIRQLKCGSTICALEVYSAVGSYYGLVKEDPWLDRNLSLFDRTNGYETDSQGQRITVTLGVYRREYKGE